jgi:hypothetical protein
VLAAWHDRGREAERECQPQPGQGGVCGFHIY